MQSSVVRLKEHVPRGPFDGFCLPRDAVYTTAGTVLALSELLHGSFSVNSLPLARSILSTVPGQSPRLWPQSHVCVQSVRRSRIRSMRNSTEDNLRKSLGHTPRLFGLDRSTREHSPAVVVRQ